jgi:hypothetical protein
VVRKYLNFGLSLVRDWSVRTALVVNIQKYQKKRDAKDSESSTEKLDLPDIKYDGAKRRQALALKIVTVYLETTAMLYEMDELTLARLVYEGLGRKLEELKERADGAANGNYLGI